MPAPTYTFAGASTFTDTATNNNVTGVSWNSGNRILVLGMTDNNTTTFSAMSNANLTFSPLSGSPTNTSSSCKGYAWSATAGSSQTGQTITATLNTTGGGGIVVFVISASDGLGTPAFAINTGKTVSLTRGGANSAVVFLAGDWDANTDVTVTADPVGGTQRVAAVTSGAATFFAFDWADQGATGTTSYGVANASGAGTLTKVAVEILGTVGGSTPRQLASAGVGI